MINLLPPKDKKELADKKTEKCVLILGYIILASLVCLILILTFLKFFILSEAIAQKTDMLQFQKESGASFLASKNDIQKINKKVFELGSFYKNNTYLTNFLKIISEIPKPEGLYFTDVYLTKGGKVNQIDAIISGFADTRDNLLIFKNNIEKDSRIKNANFSAESWTKNKNIDFYLDLKSSL